MMNQRRTGIFLSYISQIFGILSGVIYTPIMLHILGQNDYGLYSLVSSIVSTLSLLSFGFSGCYLYFFNKFRVEEGDKGVAKFNGMYMAVFLLISVICLICGVIITSNIKLFFSSGLNSEEYLKARIMFLIMVLNLAVSFPYGVFISGINANEKFVFMHGTTLIFNIIGVIINLIILFTGFGVIGLTIAALVISVLRLVIYWMFCLVKLHMKFDFKGINFGMLKAMFNFAFFIFINQMISQINGQVDKILLGRFCGTAIVAIYSIGSTIECYFQQLGGTLASVFAPEINRLESYYKVCDDEVIGNAKLLDIFIKVGRIQFMLLALIFTSFAITGKSFINLWAGEGYAESYYIALGLMASGMLIYCQTIGDAIQRAKNRHQFRALLFGIMAIVNLIISIPLLKTYGAFGAALGTMLVRLFGTAVLNWFYNVKLNLNMKKYFRELIPLIIPILCSLFTGILLVKYIKLTSWSKLIIFLIVYVIIYAFILFMLGINTAEKKYLVEFAGRIRRRKR